MPACVRGDENPNPGREGTISSKASASGATTYGMRCVAAVYVAFSAGTTPYGADDKADTAPATSAAVVDRVLTLIDTYPVADRNGKMLLVARKLVTLIGGATVSDLLTKEEIVEAAECAGLAMEGDDALDVCRKSMDSGDRTPEEFANVALEYDADAYQP